MPFDLHVMGLAQGNQICQGIGVFHVSHKVSARGNVVNVQGVNTAHAALEAVATACHITGRDPIGTPGQQDAVTLCFPFAKVGAKLIPSHALGSLGEIYAALLAFVIPNDCSAYTRTYGRAIFFVGVPTVSKFFSATLARFQNWQGDTFYTPHRAAFCRTKLKRAALARRLDDPHGFFFAALFTIEGFVVAVCSHRLTLKVQAPTQARLSKSQRWAGACMLGGTKNAPYRVATSTGVL